MVVIDPYHTYTYLSIFYLFIRIIFELWFAWVYLKKIKVIPNAVKYISDIGKFSTDFGLRRLWKFFFKFSRWYNGWLWSKLCHIFCTRLDWWLVEFERYCMHEDVTIIVSCYQQNFDKFFWTQMINFFVLLFFFFKIILSV